MYRNIVIINVKQLKFDIITERIQLHAGVRKIKNYTDESIRQHFGGILSELRNDKGLNQNELAKHFNLSKSSIAHYEQGDNFPSPSVVAGISEFFHVPIDYLYGLITHSLEYEKLNENFTQNYTYGDILKILSKMKPQEREHMISEIMYIMSYYKNGPYNMK
ncbi:MAG: helix-turn-helix transcriptional regulator [Oscillospiraceae bacterium]|nr:helix-turn-helix transcriptional regulator [Oscillospiraceae bacterium]MBR3026442.1 helix-turn-helix transcriptional regulator [Oscillospiraceae bacterium]MBR3535578.1 helix-turn-helix transcriptional regulator [Oscillospiraceae bacterium]MBR6835758.1 helix-turn-helix transcriptional regulator [Oscillospiraceae bacterium]